MNSPPTPNGLDIFPLELADELQTLEFYTRNVILWYNMEYQMCSNWFKNRYTYVLFLTKDSQNYKFNVDRVREPHIWKDYEWGGGRRSRYHPLGKNPSNFWLRTVSNKGKILEHIPLSWSEMAKRCLQSCTEQGDNVLGIVPRNRNFLKVCDELQVNPKLIEITPETEISSSRHDVSAHPSRFSIGLPRVYFKSSESMSEIRDSEIQVVVTSPPYWGLRDYGVSQQIGFRETYSQYISRLEKVWAECHRVLRNDGTLWININKRIVDGKMLLFPIDITKSCVRTGFRLQDIVIWFRAISVPGVGEKNFTDRYEFILFFSKSNQFKFYPKRIRKRDFLSEEEGELINVWKLFRKIGNLSDEFGAKTKLAVKHTAMFPEELVKRVVLLSSDKGDNVLDPFLGSGTTIAVAKKLGRTGVGYEINEAFKPIIELKTGSTEQSILRYLG